MTYIKTLCFGALLSLCMCATSNAQSICDFDGDNVCGAADRDLLGCLIALDFDPSVFPAADLDGNGVYNSTDMLIWRVVAAFENGVNVPYNRSDANLDGVTDLSDFNIWNANRFTTTCLVSMGDFNHDGVVDIADFNIWNNERFTD